MRVSVRHTEDMKYTTMSDVYGYDARQSLYSDS